MSETVIRRNPIEVVSVVAVLQEPHNRQAAGGRVLAYWGLIETA